MFNRTQQIRQDKENKIKLLLSQFELCKQKIFQHKHQHRHLHEYERREQQLQSQSRKPQSVSKNATQQPTSMRRGFQTSQQESFFLKNKIEKLENQLKEKQRVADHREGQYLRLLKEQQQKNENMQKQLDRFVLQLQTQLYEQFEDQFERFSFDNRIFQRLAYYDEKLKCLNLLIEEVRRGYKFNEQSNIVEMEEVIREKLELELQCEEYKEKLNVIERSDNSSTREMEQLYKVIQELKDDNKTKDKAIANLQKQFRQEIKQYTKKIEDIGKITNKSRTTDEDLKLLRIQYESKLKSCKQESDDQKQQIMRLKSQLERTEREIYSAELNHQKEIEKLHLEIKKLNQNMVDLEDEHGKKCQEFQGLKNDYQTIERLLKSSEDKNRSLGFEYKQLELKCETLDSQMKKMNDQMKRRPASVQRNNQKPHQGNLLQKQNNALRREIDAYKSQISELKIVLEVVNQQLNALKTPQLKLDSTGQNIIAQTPPLKNKKNNYDDFQQRKVVLSEEGKDEYDRNKKELEFEIFRHKEEIEELKKQLFKYKQREIGSQREIEEKQQIIEQLKERKVGFENLFIEMERSNEKLNALSGHDEGTNVDTDKQKEKRIDLQKQKQVGPVNVKNTSKLQKPILKTFQKSETIIQTQKKKPIENYIKSSIKDLDIRLIDSDPQQTQSHEGALSEIKEAPDLKQLEEIIEPQQHTHKFNPMMHHSFDHVDKERLKLQTKIKQLESEIDLLKSQNQTLTKKKQTFESQMIQLESREQYFIEQKERMKGELAAYVSEINNFKQHARKLISFLAIDSKSMIKSSFEFVRKAIHDMLVLVDDNGHQLQKQLAQVIEKKKGFFSIL